MYIYYLSGIPYSGELCHHGVKNQKWGIRRYQNEDGSLTALGRVHYGVGKAREVTGNAIKKIASHETEKIKRKHLWLMSDEELQKVTDRKRRENAYLSEIARQKEATRSRAGKFIGDVAGSGVKTVATKGFQRLANDMFDKKDKAARELEEVLADPTSTAKEIEAAKNRHLARIIAEKDYYNRKTYDLDNLGDIRKYNSKELDSIKSFVDKQSDTMNSINNIKKTDEYTAGRDALDDWLKSHGSDTYSARDYASVFTKDYINEQKEKQAAKEEADRYFDWLYKNANKR